MTKENYHHGNLRSALIDAGIKIINEKGEQALSLRQVAAACGVSHAAPYAHFEDKEKLLDAIKETVNESFSAVLREAIKDADDAESAIDAMGRSYILFFRSNPDYFAFLFHKQSVRIHMDMSQPEDTDDYEPYLMLRRLFLEYLEKNHIKLSPKEQELQLLKTWAIVQGFASIAVQSNVHTTLSWDEIASCILTRAF